MSRAQGCDGPALRGATMLRMNAMHRESIKFKMDGNRITPDRGGVRVTTLKVLRCFAHILEFFHRQISAQ
ncbi:MAG: hypothetical protein ACI9KN_001670 [Gammaproteobacteria bacterium]|jgi:hypothetical protein